jgi:phosphoserine phosphatase RsbU/P
MEQYLEASLRAQLVDRRQRLSAAANQLSGSSHLVHLLQQVDSALERMDRGAFGLCEGCHEPIEPDRLLADPLLCYCVDHLNAAQMSALQQDLELASRIQAGLLPQRDFRSKYWEACYHYEPAGAVSGDYCELLPPDQASGRLFFAVGDVSGKGVSASLLMSHLHALFRSLVGAGLPLQNIVQRANRIFCSSTTPSAFATLVCGRATDSGEVEICNAGHCPPLIFPDGADAVIAATGLPMGLFAGGEYTAHRLTLGPGQGLLLYTDGVTEARNGEDEEFGSGRLSAFLGSHAHQPGADLVRSCRRHLSDFMGNTPKADDVTIMLVRRSRQTSN